MGACYVTLHNNLPYGGLVFCCPFFFFFASSLLGNSGIAPSIPPGVRKAPCFVCEPD